MSASQSEDDDSSTTSVRSTSCDSVVQSQSIMGLRSDLEEQPYYHGLLARSDCDDALTDIGDFLVRISLEKDVPTAVISVRTQEGVVFHARLYTAEGAMGEGTLYEIVAGTRFQSPSALIKHYVSTKETVVNSTMDTPPIPRTFQLLNAIDRPAWHLARDQLTLEEKLGAGAFGDVFRARLRVGHGYVAVAVKSMKVVPGQYIDKAQREEFMKEARFMRKYEHANLVRMMGAVLDDLPLYLVMELCQGGSVLDRLDADPSLDELPVLQRNTWLMHVAQGMRFLHKHDVLHRDLAARNCLLDAEGNCKVGDLGMAVHHPTGFVPYSPELKVPIKWLSPEAFITRSTTPRSDVWSFGILIWEMYNNGAAPFEKETCGGMRNYHLMDNLPPLAPGPLMTKKMKAIMDSCMQRDWQKRPDFLQLKLTMRRRCRYNKMAKVSRSFFSFGRSRSAERKR